MTKMREDFEGYHVSFRDYLFFKFLFLRNTMIAIYYCLLLFIYFDTVKLSLCIVV